MKIENLNCFLAVVRTGSLHKAAEELFLTPQNLSTIIRNIEHDTGEELFVRTSKGMVLSSEGEKFLPYVNTMYNAYQEYFDSKKPHNNILNFYTTPAMAVELSKINGCLFDNQYYLSIQKRSVTDLYDMVKRHIPGVYLVALPEDQLYRLGQKEYSVILEYDKSLKVVHRSNPVLQNKIDKRRLMMIMQDYYEGNHGEALRLDNIDVIKELMRNKQAIYNCVPYQVRKYFNEQDEWVILEEAKVNAIKHCLLYHGECLQAVKTELEHSIKQLLDKTVE